MPYYFDNYGWLTSEVLTGRSTEVAPPDNLPEGQQANWSGHAWKAIPYSAPAVYTPDPVARVYSPVEWLRRFTAVERIAIRAAAVGNPVLDDYIRLMDATSEIHADDPDTIAGVRILEQAGLLAEGRAEEILNG